MGPVAGLVGGLCWLALWVADLGGGTPGWRDPVHGVGLGLLGIALALVGAGLVSRSAVWLRVLVAVACPLLVWSLYTVLRGDGDSVGLDGAIGLLAVVVSVVAAVTGRRTPAPVIARGGRHGSHASR